MTDSEFSETSDGDGTSADGRTTALAGDGRTGGGGDTTGDAAAPEYAEMPCAGRVMPVPGIPVAGPATPVLMAADAESDATELAREDISEHVLTGLFEALAGMLQAVSASR
ncbi:hypothetical protein ACQP1O_05395 [Nocardia sp. CA-151230]|uniref:hypothetical protein n=1 Tax=Nocardia sp. CA-151230 TaxID=3239982 RepID=UPI003D93685D